MWPDLARVLPRFSSAVLTFRDAEGYPFSLRCRPQPEPATQSFRLDIPPGVPVRAGPAGLLWHRHDERLWKQVSYTTRGRLEHAEAGAGTTWRYTPTHYTPGLGTGGVPAFVRLVLGARRTTAAYLARRRLARPRVPWRQINAIKAQALRK